MASKRFKDWETSITSFRTGDVIPADGPSGTAKMSKDSLLAETAQNALGSIKDLTITKYKGYVALDDEDGPGKFPILNLIESIAQVFDPEKVGGYKKLELVMHQGKLWQAKEDVPQGPFNQSDWYSRKSVFYGIKNFGFVASSGDLNDISEAGVFYVDNNATNAPVSGQHSQGFLLNFIAGTSIVQLYIRNYTTEIFTRRRKELNNWSDWVSVHERFRFYKGALSGNVDDTYVEGCYSVVKGAGVSISGTWPSDIDTTKAMNVFVSVESVSDAQNYVTQTLYNLTTARMYFRTRYSGNWSAWQSVATEKFSCDYTDQEVLKATREFEPIYPYDDQQKLFDIEGNVVSSSLHSYYYHVETGDAIKVVLGTFSSSNFAMVSLWKNGAFVKSLVNSPTTGSDFVYKITEDVDTMIVSYFASATYKAAVDKNYLDVAKPNLLLLPTSKTTHGVTFSVNEDGTINVTGAADQPQGASLEIDVTLSKGDYFLTGMPETSTRYNYGYMVVRADSSYITISYADYKQGYVFSVTEDTELVKIYVRIVQQTTIQEVVVFKPMLQAYPPASLGFAPYGKPVPVLPVYELIDCSKFNWSGKKINVIGDSIVEGRAGNWVTVIGNILHLATARNYGVGGCRLSYYGDGGSVTADDSVVARYSDMSDDADIVIVHAGTNDWASQVPLGNEDSNSNLEFNGALNIIMDGLRAKYPTALIIFSAILDRVDYDAPTHGGSTMSILTSSYSEAIKNQCKRHKMVFFDGYEICGFDFTYDYSHGHYTTNDGLHPNAGGAEIFGRKMAGFIKWH